MSVLVPDPWRPCTPSTSAVPPFVVVPVLEPWETPSTGAASCGSDCCGPNCITRWFSLVQPRQWDALPTPALPLCHPPPPPPPPTLFPWQVLPSKPRKKQSVEPTDSINVHEDGLVPDQAFTPDGEDAMKVLPSLHLRPSHTRGIRSESQDPSAQIRETRGGQEEGRVRPDT